MNYYLTRPKSGCREIGSVRCRHSCPNRTDLSFSSICLGIIAAGVTFGIPLNSDAQEKSAPLKGVERITVDVRTSFAPSKFEGLVISPTGVITEKVNPSVAEVAPNFYSVTFPIDRETEGSSIASAVAFAGDDALSVGTVVSIQSASTNNACSSQDPDPVTLEIDAGTIRALCANRLKRRDHNRKIFELSFNQFPRRDIETVERNFGLHSNEKPGEDLNPFRMIERISRLISALDGWNFRKSSILPSSPSGSESTSSAEGSSEESGKRAAATAPQSGDERVPPSITKAASEP